MNVLFLYINGVIPNIGGIARITNTLGCLFRENGHKVYYLGYIKRDGCQYDSSQFFLPSSIVFCEENLLFFEKLIKENKIDLIINQASTHSGFIKLIGRIKSQNRNISAVTCFHTSILTQAYNFAYQEEFRLRKENKIWLLNLLKKRVVRFLLINAYIFRWRSLYRRSVEISDKCVLLNDGQKEELSKMIGRRIDDKCVIIPNCIPTDNGKVDLSSKKKIVLWVGTFNCRIKRPDIMISVWTDISKVHPDWKLIMAGDGPDFVEMKQYAQSLNAHDIEFTGRVSTEDLYKRSSVVCVTSTHESFSLVALEGMMNGCPVVLFDSFPMASKLVENDVTGFLIKPFDGTEFRERLSALLSNRHKIAEMGISATEASKKYTTEEIYSYWNEELFKNIKR